MLPLLLLLLLLLLLQAAQEMRDLLGIYNVLGHQVVRVDQSQERAPNRGATAHIDRITQLLVVA